MFKFKQLRRNHRYASWEELANTFDAYRSQERTKIIVAGFGFCGILSGIFSNASTFKDRIDKLETDLKSRHIETHNRIDKLENRIDKLETKIDAKFDLLFSKLFVANPGVTPG